MMLLILAIGLFTVASAEQPQVTTTLGPLKGLTMETIFGRKFHGFQGVPYAEPPIGERRFKQSVPGKPWTGVLNATRILSMCMQLKTDMLFKNVPFDVLGSEDCLYMNIYTPKLPSELPDGKLLDVIFNIHGGAFQMAAGHFMGPEHILDRDVVYVNFNYRMGVLGFLSLEDETCPGNNGLKDQNLALKWVNKHIAAFGGNPNSITIVGDSAGGASVHYHVLSPMSKGLFQKAVSSSGAATNPWAVTKRPREKSLVIARSVGCPMNDSSLILECLRNRPAEQLTASVKNLEVWNEMPIVPIGPVIEQPSATAFIDQLPVDAIRSKQFNDVPIIFSYTNDEGSVFIVGAITSERLLTDMETKWEDVAKTIYEIYDTADPSNAKDLPQTIRKHYLGDKKITEAIPEFVQSLSDRWFVNGIQEAAILHAQHQASPVYMYRFSYPGDEGFNLKDFFGNVSYEGGAGHGFDHTILFKSPFFPPIRNAPRPLQMVSTLSDYYVNFLTQSPVPSWETVNSGLPNLKFLDIVDPDPKKNVFKTEKPLGPQFWDTLKLHENSRANMKGQSS